MQDCQLIEILFIIQNKPTTNQVAVDMVPGPLTIIRYRSQFYINCAEMHADLSKFVIHYHIKLR